MVCTFALAQRYGIFHRRMKISSLKMAMLILCLTIMGSTVHAETQNDFDGDGRSDYTGVTVSGNDLLWQNTGSTSGQHEIDDAFGISTDVVTLADWFSAGAPTLGTVRTNLTDNALVWRVQEADQRISTENLGKPGDLIVSGADFDGNGIADAAVVRQVGKKLRWSIRLNMFTSEATTKQLKFGKVGDRVFFFSPDGEHDDIAVFGLTSNGKRAQLQYRDGLGGKVTKIRKFSKKLAQGTRPRPFPIQSEDGTDLIGFATDDGIDTTVQIFTVDGTRTNHVTLNGTGTLFVGDYLPDSAGEEVALQTASKLFVYSVDNDELETPTKVSGTPVDQINIAQTMGAVVPTAVPTATATPTATPTP